MYVKTNTQPVNNNIFNIKFYMRCLMLAFSFYLALPVNTISADDPNQASGAAPPIVEDDQADVNQPTVVLGDQPTDDFRIFLPVMITSNDNGTTTPPVQGEEVAGEIGYYRSVGNQYDEALNGGVNGQFSQSIFNTSPDYIVRSGQEGDHPEGFPEVFEVNRSFIDFDTTSLTTVPTQVYLHVKIIGKPGSMVLPQTIHRGTWTGIAQAFHSRSADRWQLWSAFDSAQIARFLTTESQGVSEDQPLDLYIELPVDFIQSGDISHLVIRSNEEGTPPPSGDNCTECRRFVTYKEFDLIIVQ